MASTPTTGGDNIASLQEEEAKETLRYKTLWQKALWRIRHDPLTLTALIVLGILVTLCFSAPLIVRLLDIEYNNNDPYSNRLSPGARVADSNTTAYTWDVATGEIVRNPIGHNDTVLSIGMSPDGDIFATASADGTVRLWRTSIAGFIRVLETHEETHEAVNAVIFHPGGEWFLTASDDGTAQLWPVDKPVRTDPDVPVMVFEGHTAGVTSAAFSPDGTQLLTGSADGTARLWSVPEGDLLRSFGATPTAEGEAAPDAVAINAVAYSPDGATILAGSADGTIQVWDASNGAALDSFTHDDAVTMMHFNAAGDLLLTASADGTARLWDVAAGEVAQTFSGHDVAVYSAVFGTDENSVITAGADGTTYLWDAASGEVTQTFNTVDYPVHAAVMTPDGTTIITGTEGRRRMYLLGTDGAGRDLATRLLYGGQVSLKIGLFSALGSLTIGIVLGIASGFYRGRFDDVVMWIITTLNSIPQLFLLLIISAMLAPNENTLILVLVFLGWTGATRIVRGETFALREREFVLAARAIGASPLRIMFVHIAPNVISVLLIVMTRSVGGLILTESALSFLGFGVKQPTPTWGNMLTGGLDLLREAPHIVFAPGLLISLTVLCLYTIGDGLRDAFDPRLSD
jgi:peptide/nickel transport system permease protein